MFSREGFATNFRRTVLLGMSLVVFPALPLHAAGASNHWPLDVAVASDRIYVAWEGGVEVYALSPTATVSTSWGRLKAGRR